MTEILIHLLLSDGRHGPRSPTVRARARHYGVTAPEPRRPTLGGEQQTFLTRSSECPEPQRRGSEGHNEQAERVRPDRSSARLRGAGSPTREVRMSWLLIAVAVWLAVSLPLALLIVRTIHEADTEAGTTEETRDQLYVFHVLRSGGE